MIAVLSQLVPLASQSNRTVEGSGIGDTEPDQKAFSGFSRSRQASVLIRHRLRADWKQPGSEELSAVETLEAFALKNGADLLTIGAFAHSRLMEAMFGGVTRSLLDKARLQVLSQ